MRTIVIGDIHGCLDEFKELVENLNLTPDDQVFCLGDFLDKGPDPVGALRYARQQGFSSIKGNHEERHWKWRRNVAREAREPGYRNAMRPFHTEDELRQNGELTQEDLDWIESLPYYQEVAPGFIAVHGGLLPGLSLDQQPPDKIIRARWVDPQTGKPVPTDYDAREARPPGTLHWTEMYSGPYNVIYGHEAHSLTTPRYDRTVRSQCYGIDTGCVHGGRLTALVLDEGLRVNFVQVTARRKYADPQWPIPQP
jgi:diadenosine tetraphosphatase ApaH/serine/threonine PP2A family protein phosphatase